MPLTFHAYIALPRLALMLKITLNGHDPDGMKYIDIIIEQQI